MTKTTQILIASDVLADAEVVDEMLREEHKDVTVSVNPDKIAEEFEAVLPDVLVLAFNSIEKAGQYELILKKMSEACRSHTYRSVLLCEGKSVQAAYKLCKKGVYDDYVVFWPIGHDVSRLMMCVHQALLSLDANHEAGPTQRDFAAQAGRIAQLESQLESLSKKGDAHISRTSQSIASAKAGIASGFDEFSSRLTDGDVLGSDAHSEALSLLSAEIDRLKTRSIDAHMTDVESTIAPLDEWNKTLKVALEPHRASISALSTMATEVRYSILIVDDDSFQHKIIERIIAHPSYDLRFVSSASEAGSAIKARRPDVILLDVDMPGVNGIEALEQMRSNHRLSGVSIFMITGHRETEIVRQCVQSGATGYVVKPFTDRSLVEKIESALGKPRSEQPAGSGSQRPGE